MRILKRILMYLLFVLLCLAVFGTATVLSFAVTSGTIISDSQAPLHVDWNESVGTVFSDLSYGDGPFHTYDLYVPADPAPDQTFPLILLIHGGGFTGGDKGDDAVWGKFFAANGYVLASINYTLMTEDNPVGLPTMFQDTRNAVKAICGRAQEMGYPLTEMAVTGASAGGTLALMYAFHPPEDAPLPVRFVFEQSGPVSFTLPAWNGDPDGDPTEIAAAASAWTGMDITPEMVETGEYLKYIDAISPVSFVNEHTVPVLMAYGVNDKVVPPIHRELLLQALEASNVPHEYIEFPRSGHGLLGDPGRTETYVAKIMEYAGTYFQGPSATGKSDRNPS